MLKVLVVTTVLALSLNASSGEEIYKQKCSSCHQLKGMMDMSQMKKMQQKMKNATQEEKMAMKDKMKAKMEKSGMKAPAFNMVSMRIKKMKNGKKEFIAFVEDYIQNPSQDKGVCMPMAYKRFGVMPPIGKGMSKDERKIIATWLYENFKSSWDSSMDAKMCKSNNKNMKCGSNKCGGDNKNMRCGANKCGSK